eukprot:TRINITY_DN111826_c0_g1_i1.p1 TRINITY_DN111826_c0_g1~~TRINITY_DN111826_c0_g1_i1.p1  ORF type:complete len:359 (-),score=23.14 TRINITY_DN111826_c0_g1_i1:52-1128(-)
MLGHGCPRMMQILIALLTQVEAVTHLDCHVVFQQIHPSETGSDANATDKDATHWVFPGRILADEPLRVFLPGTSGHPSEESYLLKSITECDKPTIGLSYSFETSPDASRDLACKMKYGEDMASRGKCLADQHSDAIWGGNSQPDLWQEIESQDSINGRLALLLSFLDQKQPDHGWNAYIDRGMSNQVRWDRIVLGGHSQGAGHSAYMAQTTMLHGAVLLSGPQDDASVPNTWVDRKLWATTRVVAAKHANETAEETIGANWRRMAMAVGWPNDGRAWDLGHALQSPPYGTVVSNIPPASLLIPRPYHCSMALDVNTPINSTLASGQKQALYAMFLWPGLYDLAANFVTDLPHNSFDFV